MDLDVKIEVKYIWDALEVVINGTEYKSETQLRYLTHTPFKITHEPLGWNIKLGYREF